MNIVEWSQSKYGFYVDRHYVNNQWHLQPGPIKLAPYHAAILEHIFTPDDTGKLPYDVVGWCEPAKSGKSAIAGLVAEYMGLHGEKNSAIIMASNNQNQAQSIMFKSLTDSVTYNPHLPKVDPKKLSVRFRNGNEVKAIASNSRGQAGQRFSLALFDEPAGYVYEDARRLWVEFKTDPTRLNSMRFCIGYAGYSGVSELWENLLNSGLAGEPIDELAHITNDDGSPTCYRNGRTFVFWSHVPRQPWHTDERLENERKALADIGVPFEFDRMFLCRFVEGLGNFVLPSEWAALIDPNHKPLAAGSDKPVYVGLDVALAPGGDDCALIGVYPEDDKVKVAFHKVWKGKDRKTELKLKSTVYPYLIAKRDDHNLRGVWFDPYQAQYLADDLRRAGIRCIQVNQNKSSSGRALKDTALYEMTSNKQLVLYDHPELANATAGANVEALGNGLIFLKKVDTRSKIDLLVALSNCADECIFRAVPQLQISANPFYA